MLSIIIQMSEDKKSKNPVLDDLIQRRRAFRGGSEIVSPSKKPDSLNEQSVDSEIEADNLFELFYEHIPYGVLFAVIDRDRYGKPVGYRIKKVNLNYARLLGVERVDLLSRPFIEVIPGGNEDWGELLADVSTKRRHHKRICYFEETDKYLEVIVFKPRKEYLAVILNDAREEVKTVSSVERKETESRDILDLLPGLVCRFKPDGELLFANDAYRNYASDPESLCGHCFLSEIPANEQDYVMSRLALLTRNHSIITYEHSIFVNGKTRWAQWTDRALFDRDGGLVGYVSSGTDITERKKSDVTLKERCGFMEDLVDHHKSKLHGVSAGASAVGKHVSELEDETSGLRNRLQVAMGKSIVGHLSVCSQCGRIHDEEGHWEPVEMYMRTHTLATVGAETCPYCKRTS